MNGPVDSEEARAPEPRVRADSADDALGLAGIAALSERFDRHLRDEVAGPLHTALDRYVAALRAAVDAMHEAVPETAAEPDSAEEARTAAGARLRYVERFRARFGEALFHGAAEARSRLFDLVDRVTAAPPELPDTVRALNLEDPEIPELVRPGWRQRLAAAWKRPTERTVPVRLLADLYIAELSRRLEPVASDAARLTAVAVAGIRRQLHAHTDLESDEAGTEELAGAAAAVADGIDAAVAEVRGSFDRAIGASLIEVPERRAEDSRGRGAGGRARTLEEWSALETTLMANVAAEAVLARALAEMDATVGASARKLEAARDAGGVEPLERLAAGMSDLRDRAERDLAGGFNRAVLEGLTADAVTLFEAELPRLDGLRQRLEALTAEIVDELDGIPGLVPGDLQISESPVPRIPDRPRKLQLRDAPLEELLRTACAGTLPRWLEKGMATAGEELDAMGDELRRARHAVEFQLRAPLRGGFDAIQTLALAVGITERTVSQLVDLRAQGLKSVDALVAGLEGRAREEAEALRSAVANREFMRIHSEIAEEQAVRQLSTGAERLRAVGAGMGRVGVKAWDLGRRAVTAVQDWAERQLGVGDVEREEMLESLEQSLLGEDQQVVDLPAMYRQLFDVEAGVPWDELLVSRDPELEVIRRAFARWQEDRAASVAVVGEKGSGKSTLIRLARQQLFSETPVVEIDFGRSLDDPAELDARLRQAFGLDADSALADAINGRPPAVAIVEDLHHLFVRALGGFDAMEAFLEVVAATGHTILWVVTVDALAWRYIDRVLGVEAHFVHRVSTTELPPEKLERAIMARHDVSGFALRFETGAEDARNGRWSRLLGRRREAGGELTRKESQRRRYFHQLAAIAEGNIVLALFYWLRSIERIEEHVLVLGEPEIIELEFLERLPLAHLHTIAAIILHGGLSETTHRRVFQIPAAESRLRLAALADAHMIFLAGDGEYKINKVLYRPFIRLLASKNIF